MAEDFTDKMFAEIVVRAIMSIVHALRKKYKLGGTICPHCHKEI